jgi:hypothetical protein
VLRVLHLGAALDRHTVQYSIWTGSFFAPAQLLKTVLAPQSARAGVESCQFSKREPSIKYITSARKLYILDIMIAGVEENSQSRFIDYTFATPWESLVSDLEHAIKRWICPGSVTVHPDELDHSATLSALSDDGGAADQNVLESSSAGGSPTLFEDSVTSDRDVRETFDGRKVETSGPNGSYKETKGAKEPYKVVFTYSDEKYGFYYCKDGVVDDDPGRQLFYEKLRAWFDVVDFFLLTGLSRRYAASPSQRQTLLSALCSSIHSSGCLNVPAFFLPVDFVSANSAAFLADIKGYEVRAVEVNVDEHIRCVLMYETSVLDGIDSHNELLYLDGLLKHFDHKLFSLSVGSVSAHDTVCSTTEVFHYSHDGSSLSQRTQPPTKYPLLTNSELKGSGVSGGGYTYSHFNYLTQLWCLFPDYVPSSAATSELEIRIRYPDLRQGAFMDNERYTTLQPSKQEACHWSVRAAFKPLHKVATKRMAIDGQLHMSSSTVASCLRRLLSFFTYSHCCCPSDVTMTALLKLNKQSPDVKIRYVDRAQAVIEASKATSKTMAIFDEMFSKVARTTKAPEANKYMSLIFSQHNRWPTAYNGDLEGKEPSTLPASLGSLTELLGVAIGSLAVDMQSVAEMWSDCVLELRRHWEMDLPLPAAWNPILAKDIDESRLDLLEMNSLVPATLPAHFTMGDVAESAWTRHLWNDCLSQKNDKEGSLVTIPDRAQSVLVQKLQYLNFCIIMKRESSFRFVSVERPLRTVDAEARTLTAGTSTIALLRRVPLTSDAAAQRKHLEAKFTSGKSQSMTDNPLLRWQITHPALISDIRSFKHKFPARTLEDFLQWYTGDKEILSISPPAVSPPGPISPQVSGYDSRATSPTSLMSPVTPSSLGSPSPGLDSEAWRGAVTSYDEPMSSESWPLLWGLCEPAAASNQRIMFRVETEAEKCIAYLEDLNARNLSVRLLHQAIIAAYVMLRGELRPWRLPTVPLGPGSREAGGSNSGDDASLNRRRVVSADSDDIVEDEIFPAGVISEADVDMTSSVQITKELAQLRSDINAFEVQMLQFCQSSVSSSSPTKSITFNWSVAEFIGAADRIISKLEAFEERIVHFHEMGTVLMLPSAGSGSRFVTTLCREGSSSARTSGDVQSLHELVKFVSRGAESHSWNSEDGRELGKPTQKTFSLRCDAASRLVDNTLAEEGSALMNALEHAMYAQSEQGRLFVATKFCELDS